jgi:hypothetical protein
MLARVREIPAAAWLGAAAVLGLAVLVWHDWTTNSDEETRWLDDDQPALQLDAPSAHLPSIRPRSRPYPPCLAAWPGTVIGDC